MASIKLDNVLDLLAARKGHFLLESGHHGDLWLDLEVLFKYPKRIEPLCFALAERLSRFKIDVICGPLIEGAFVGLFIASELGLAFSYSERFARPTKDGLFPAGYRIPDVLRDCVRGKRVAIVNDVINAGSAVRGTFDDLNRCGAEVVAIATLLTLGNSAYEFAATKNLAFETLVSLPNELWTPAACPLCAMSVPLQDVANFNS